MFYSYLLSASALAAMSLGALPYTVAGPGERKVDGAQPRTSVDRRPDHLSARYREQMKLTQEALRDFGHTPGPSDGVMGFATASALRAFQRQDGLRVTGRVNRETLTALGIEDTLSRSAP
jgi:peptidoglycan hydrolase-like protein with peptidoglycan-binding domain